MGLTPWETHRDVLIWKKAGLERDLATLSSIPKSVLDTDTAKAMKLDVRQNALIAAIQHKLDVVTIMLDRWEQARP